MLANHIIIAKLLLFFRLLYKQSLVYLIILKSFEFLYRRVGTRVFRSAAISKRHNTVTLETADGISITICNFINSSRTHQNGFDSEVCNSLLLHYWLHDMTFILGIITV